jgi:molybdopterin-guanine dinucleotide biosynthesis protein A
MSLNPVPDLTAFVLAGGKSRRMGSDKAFVMFKGERLLARAIQVCRAVTSNVIIVGDRKKFSPYAPVVEDIFPGCGPLAGIHAALRASHTDLNLLLAVDLPFVGPGILRYLLTQAGPSEVLVTVPRAEHGLHPLCAIYRPGFSDLAENSLRQGRYKIDALFDTVNTNVIEEDVLQAAGFSPHIFRNLNTPEELAEAQATS